MGNLHCMFVGLFSRFFFFNYSSCSSASSSYPPVFVSALTLHCSSPRNWSPHASVAFLLFVIFSVWLRLSALHSSLVVRSPSIALALHCLYTHPFIHTVSVHHAYCPYYVFSTFRLLHSPRLLPLSASMHYHLVSSSVSARPRLAPCSVYPPRDFPSLTSVVTYFPSL